MSYHLVSASGPWLEVPGSSLSSLTRTWDLSDSCSFRRVSTWNEIDKISNQNHRQMGRKVSFSAILVQGTLKYASDLVNYPIPSVNNGEMGCWEMHSFATPSDSNSHGSWHKSKNPYSLSNHMIPNLATAINPGTTWPVASWFLGTNGYFIGNDVFPQWVLVLAVISL